MKSIGYAANVWGYVVQVCENSQVVEEYHAGNHQQDSQITVRLDSPHVTPLDTLQDYAKKIALEMANEWSISMENVAYDSDLEDEINELNSIYGVIELPACWKRLVQTEFDGGIGSFILNACLPNGKTIVVTNEHNCKGNDDPDPHYDDRRSIGAKMPDGVVLSIDLQSGQSNYYASASLSDGSEIIYEDDDVIESFSSPLELEATNGKTYVVEIKWVGTDPYAE